MTKSHQSEGDAMSTILAHPTKEQEEWLEQMRHMRQMMLDDDPGIDSEAAAIIHMLNVQEELAERRLRLREYVIVALTVAVIVAVAL